MDLAQQGYPKPKDFTGKEFKEIIPQYAVAVGGTDKIRQFIEWIDTQTETVKRIKEKYESDDKYAI